MDFKEIVMDAFPIATLYKYSSVHSLPSYVKTAHTLDQEEDISKLPATAFAAPGRRLPVHTKAATWLSYMSAVVDGVKPELKAHVMARLDKAAKYWGIQADCEEIAENHEKTANETVPVEYALEASHHGEPVTMWPMGNLKHAAEMLINDRSLVPYGWRKQAARRILKKAEEQKIDLGNSKESVEKTAGFGSAPAEKIAAHLRMRAYGTRNKDVRERATKMAEVLATRSTPLDAEELEKTAEAIDTLDRLDGAYQQYGRGVTLPEDVVFATTQSQARKEASDQIRLTNGSVVLASDLRNKSAETFSALGDDFVDLIEGENGNVDIAKAAEVVPTLPMDDANLFVSAARG